MEFLPLELQNKIYSYVGVHPCAKMIKKNRWSQTEHYIFYHDCMIYENPYRRRKWRAGECMLCKKNGRKLYYERYIYKSEVCKCCCNFKSIAYYQEYYDDDDDDNDSDNYKDSDDDD